MRKNQRGDTIVEVLIAIVVCASLLATTFVAMNRNLLLTRVSQERSEASKLAQGQLEALKTYTDNSPTTPSGTFCFGAAGYTPGSCTSDFYTMSVVKDPAVPKLYRIIVTWDRIGGGGTSEQVTMVYRTAK